MPRKRRKLNKDSEKQIAAAKREVELIGAKVNDISDEDIQVEYLKAYLPIKNTYSHFSSLYESEGFTPEFQQSVQIYNDLLNAFHTEYEL